MHTYSNKLLQETSPYLLQHAHNPVDWYPWGDEALQRARKENKPILVSIGYSACHWCHVMERESFEDEATAVIMNEHFINIKIDREERPDLDHIYMDAVQAMTGSGGWPLNVFLTPDGKPFYGGTYFPPQKAFNRPSWQDVLNSVTQAFRERRHEIDAQAENLTAHLLQSNAFGLQKPGAEEPVFTSGNLEKTFEAVMKSADKQWGGFGKAPKFPQTFTIQFLLRYYYVSGNTDALQQALLSLDKMVGGGIYDQVGGGFARYSTDTEWLVPHFEKMLYDNALLVSVLSEAFQQTKNEKYKEITGETIAFIERELMHPGKGFYAALDADSEGVEGKFYVWTYEEVNELLGKDTALFCAYYDIRPGGNWEGQTILWTKESAEEFAANNKISVNELSPVIEKCKKLLLAERSKRVRPSLDDKIILGWNALMNTALGKAFAATGDEHYKQLAIDNMNFLFEKLAAKDAAGFHHTWKKEQARFPAFLDDYAFLIQALLQLQEITGDTGWLDKAVAITNFVIGQFSGDETGYFFYTPQNQPDIIVRKKEVYDGAVPSGNAVMAANLYQLSVLMDKQDWRDRSFAMISGLANAIIKYPTSFAVWAGLFLEITDGTAEIVITGQSPAEIHKDVLKMYLPHKVVMVASDDSSYPLVDGKPITKKTNIWLCKNYACRAPVSSAGQLITLINKGKIE